MGRVWEYWQRCEVVFMDEQQIETIWNFAKSLEGKTISTENAIDNMHFVEDSKKRAEGYDWLYHCTKADSLLGILKSREFWLSNLKIVNDKEETDRIDVPEYEKTFYVGSFTYDPNIPEEHWKEYGDVLIGVRREWFLRKATFMCGSNQKCHEDFFTIHDKYDDALNEKIEREQGGRLCNPFYINEFEFYQVLYDDDLVKTIVGKSTINLDGVIVPGISLTPSVAGIIKKIHGPCCREGREPYDKDWKSEKEVRLKVGIQQLSIKKNGYEIHDGMIMDQCFSPKIAVPISDDAFDTLKIGFNSLFTRKTELLREIQTQYPDMKLEML